MEENRNEEQYGSDIKIKSPLTAKLENFWYYYKWHSIAALFLVICIVVCSLQMCTKEAVDFNIMYASGSEISRKSVDGDTPAYNRVVSAFDKYVEDADGDGSKNIAFTTYFILSPDEIKEIENTPDKEVNYALMSSDTDALSARFGVGDYYLCFVSEYVYEQYRGTDDLSVFAPIRGYAPEGDNELEYYSDYAIRLDSTPLYKNNPAIRENMPADTLVTIQIKRVVGVGKDNDEKYARAEEVLRKMLSE